MADNEALNIVIGIVLIYLLYSMLITILGEFVSAKLGMRSRILRVALDRMLNDGYYRRIDKVKLNQTKSKRTKLKFWFRRHYLKIQSGFRDFLLRNFLYEPDAFKTSFAGRFYDHPAIKYLSRSEGNRGILRFFKQSKPAYISADYFSDTIINMLKDKSTGATDTEKIAFTFRYNTQHIQPTTLKLFKDHFENAGNDIALFKINLIKWFNETMDRANGWYKRKLQIVLLLLGFFVAAAFNVDTIKIVKILSSNKEARRQLVDMGIQLSKDTTRYKDFTKATKDSIRTSAVIDSGLLHINKDISDVNNILGIGWTLAGYEKKDSYTLPKDSLSIAFSMQFETAVKFRKEVTDSLAKHRKALEQVSRTLDTTTFTVQLLANRVQLQGPVKGPVDSLKAKQVDTARLRLIKSGLAIQLNKDSLVKLNNEKTIKSLQEPFLLEGYTRLDTVKLDKETIKFTGYRKYSGLEKSGLFADKVFSNFIGLLLTAIALSLGAPFWFDLLNKLVSIRSAGIKPVDKPAEEQVLKQDDKKTVKPKNTTPSLPVNNSTEQALDSFTRKIASEPGIVSVGLNQAADKILVKVKDPSMQKYLSQKFGSLYQFNPLFQIGIQYALSAPNSVQTAACGSGITNQNKPNETGTLGCYLKKTDSTANYFLSCWHVINDDDTYDKSIKERNVISKGTSEVIGEVVDGCLTDKIDVGIAIEKPVKGKTGPVISGIRRQHREVIPYDSLMNTPVALIGKMKNATIFDYKLNIKLEYPDGQEYMIYDVFSITVAGSAGTLTTPTAGGDSGSVVVDSTTGTPLGMIIGGNNQFSYAVKFSNIFSPGTPYHEYSFITK